MFAHALHAPQRWMFAQVLMSIPNVGWDYDALDIACVSGDYTEITSLVAASVQRSLDVYLGVLGLRPAHESHEPFKG